jgi:tripartite-type tricarboxylate transporter receptor subunit TctC
MNPRDPFEPHAGRFAGKVAFVSGGGSVGPGWGNGRAIAGRLAAEGAQAFAFPPDGQTLWLTSVGAVAINPSLYEKLAYDPQHDLAPVSLVVRNVEVLVVPPDAPWASGAEFIAAARQATAKPLTLASSGIGSVPHLAMELLADATRTRLVHVAYKGAAPAINDVMTGHVNGFFGDIPGLIGFIKGGKLKPIGIAAPRRHPLLPEVKTFAEMGVAGVDSDNWHAIFTGRAVPAATLERVNQALRRALENDAVKQRLMASGAEPAPSSPAGAQSRPLAALAGLLRPGLARGAGLGALAGGSAHGLERPCVAALHQHPAHDVRGDCMSPCSWTRR